MQIEANMNEAADYFKNVRPEIVPFLPETYSRVLEIGCGAGMFGSQLSNSEIWGVEPDIDAAKVAAECYETVLTGYYDDVAQDIPNGFFDLVICNDVIEHVQDHDVFLSSINSKLKSGGSLVGSVPNVRYYKNLYQLLFLKQWDYVDAGILDRTHLRFFTERSLRSSLQRTGFHIEMFSGINSAFEKGIIKNIGKFFFLAPLSLFTLGGSSDLKFLQFAFRVMKK